MQTDTCNECVGMPQDYLCEVCDSITCPSCGEVVTIYIAKPHGAYCVNCADKGE